MNTHQLKNLFRFPCPTSSPVKALVWFELKSSGLRVLAAGLAIAVLIYLLFAISIPYVFARPFAFIGTFGVVPAMLIFGRNAFGIRRSHGRTSISSFEAIQPCGTARLAGVKVLVRTSCVIIAMIVIGVSVWKSTALVSDWGVGSDVKPATATSLIAMRNGLLHTRSTFAKEFFGEDGSGRKASTGVLIALVLIVTALASFTAFRARYPRRTLVVSALLLLFSIGLSNASESWSRTMQIAAAWLIVTALSVTTLYLLRHGFAERALTIRYVCGALSIAVANLVISLPGPAVSIAVALLLPLMICLFAPWSLSRIRHT